MNHNSWMLVKVRYTKELDNGTFKRVTEPYLLAAHSFTDAEARIYEELGSIIRGEFTVVSIARQEIHDIFAYDDSDVWYVAKVSYKSEPDESEKSKTIKNTFLVSAHSVKDGYDRIKESLSTLMVDYKIDGVVVSPIVEIFPVVENLDREISREPLRVTTGTLTAKNKVQAEEVIKVANESGITTRRVDDTTFEYDLKGDPKELGFLTHMRKLASQALAEANNPKTEESVEG